MNGYEVFQTYKALKLHFTSAYDFTKYSGKVGTKIQYQKGGRVFFDKIAKKYPNPLDIKMLFVSNMVVNPNIWIKDIISDSAHKELLNWKLRNKTLTERFKNDLTTIKRVCDNKGMIYNDVFVSPDKEHPIIINMVLDKTIDFESFCILNELMNFKPFLNRDLKGDLIWENLKEKVENYTCFINFDKVKLFQIAKAIF